jgi:DNA-binding PadR family transcriptional regulator
MLSKLQLLFLGAIGSDKAKGREIREQIAKLGQRKSAPVFYQLAARLEDDNLIEGWYEERAIAGQVARERHYKLTAYGKQALNEVLQDAR